MCSSTDELYNHISRDQLTSDIGGKIDYDHKEWIQQRAVSLIAWNCLVVL